MNRFRDVPWPEPCCPCVAGENGHSTEFTQDGNYWHTASWNRTTGLWIARCCMGHRKSGSQAVSA